MASRTTRLAHCRGTAGMLLPSFLRRQHMAGQAVRFVVVGLVNTVVDLGAFYLLGLIPGMSEVAAKAISYNLGTVNGFLLNKYWTISARYSKHSMREFAVFFGVNVPPLVVDVVIFAMLGLWATPGTFWMRMAKAFAAAAATAAWSFSAAGI
jgi:putative flippase GtrA